MEGHLLSHEDWEVLNARPNTDMFGSEAGKCLLAKYEDPLTIQYSSRGWAQLARIYNSSTGGRRGRDRQIPGTHQAVNPAKFSETQSQKLNWRATEADIQRESLASTHTYTRAYASTHTCMHKHL